LILLLRESSAAKRNDPRHSPAQLFEQLLQGSVFRAAEFGFARIAENLGYGTPLARCDAVIEIFKGPIQAPP
jgi:hypothetical protein